MSTLYQFNINMDFCMKEMQAAVSKHAMLKEKDTEQSLVAVLFADDTVLLAESERMLQRIAD